jgi:hypothetical protein
MKKIFTFFLLTIAIQSAFGQAIPNGNFENWYPISYDSLHYYRTSNNDQFVTTQVMNVSKDSPGQNSNFCVKMETRLYGSDTLFGYFTNGDPTTGAGGIPYNQLPTSLKGYWKGNIMSGDTGLILVVCKLAGTIISSDLYKITGNAAAFTAFTMPLSPPLTPDTILLASASSNGLVDFGIPGSTLWLDSLYFAGPTVLSQPTYLNGDFELWSSVPYMMPQDWDVTARTPVQTTDSYLGNYALALSAVSPGDPVYPNYSFATTGIFLSDSPYVQGGRPFTNLVDTVFGYYKFYTTEMDTARIEVYTKNNGNWVGFSSLELTSATSYTYFQIPISSFSTPDSMLIVVNPFSNPPGGPGSNMNLLVLDEIQLKTEMLTTGIKNNPFANGMSVWPLPAKNEINVSVLTCGGAAVIRIYDLKGDLVLENNSVSKPTAPCKIDISTLESGIYILKMEIGSKTFQRKIVKE